MKKLTEEDFQSFITEPEAKIPSVVDAIMGLGVGECLGVDLKDISVAFASIRSFSNRIRYRLYKKGRTMATKSTRSKIVIKRIT